jgi:hypothetical protein
MKKILENLTYLAIGITFTFLLIYVLDLNWERRFTLYHIRNELKKDISKAEVEEIINRHRTTFIERIETKEGICLLVHLGMADSLSLNLTFSENKLKSAVLAGEDHPQDVPTDAPPNLE